MDSYNSSDLKIVTLNKFPDAIIPTLLIHYLILFSYIDVQFLFQLANILPLYPPPKIEFQTAISILLLFYTNHVIIYVRVFKIQQRGTQL